MVVCTRKGYPSLHVTNAAMLDHLTLTLFNTLPSKLHVVTGITTGSGERPAEVQQLMTKTALE